jgi:hypothetical protein
MSASEREIALPIGYAAADGQVSRTAVVRKMRGHEEALLYDASLSSGRLVTELVAGCLVRLGEEREVTPSLVSQLFSADRNYLLLEIRRFTLGDALPCAYLCPSCGEDVPVLEDLSRIEVRRHAGETAPKSATIRLEDGYRDRDGAQHLDVTIRLPRGEDEEFVADTAERDPLRARDVLALRCIEAFGTLPRAALEAYGVKILRDLTLGDRQAIYRALDGDAPGVDFKRSLRCEHCGAKFEALLDAANFFLVA